MKDVTIATDVSCDDRYEISVWACYIKCGDRVIKKTGQFKQFYANTSTAETYALINALTIAKKHIPNWSDSNVTIHNEVQYVLDPIKTKAGNIKKRDAERAEAIKSIAMPILREALHWERHKIKAHYHLWYKAPDKEKYLMNRWCDMNSREMLKQIREEKIIQ